MPANVLGQKNEPQIGMELPQRLAIPTGIEDNLGFVGVTVLNYILKENASRPEGCVLWMHGLGADAHDMAGLAANQAIKSLPLRHVFMDAPLRPVTLNGGMMMRAWYDILGMDVSAREDREGILQSRDQILEVIELQKQAGFKAEQIVLAGFSQGGAMALSTALNSELSFAGVLALSSYLPLAAECRPMLQHETPFFLGFGQHDTLILPEWTRQSEHWLRAQGYDRLTVKQYPMEHAVCQEEIVDVASWLSIHLKGVAKV